MKRNSKAVAFVLTLALLFAAGCPTAVFAGTIEGDSTVNDVAINVILPTTLDFILDPLGLAVTEGNQISTQDYFFVNQTLAPVKVAIDITATTSNGAVLVTTTSGINKDSTNVTSKAIYFGALGATGLTGTAITATGTALTTPLTEDTETKYTTVSAFFGSDTKAEYSSVSAAAPTLSTFDASGSANISFALNKAVAGTTPGTISTLATTSNSGIAAFQFYAELNTYADWKANDITVTGTYTLTPLRVSTYDGFVANDMIAGGLNQLEPAEDTPAPTPVGFTGGTTSTSINVGDITGTTLVVPFNFGSQTLTRITTAGGNDVAADLYTFSVANKTITYLETRTDALKGLATSTSNTIYLDDGSTYVINFIK